MTWDISKTTDQETCFALRHQVFVLEQGVPQAEEIDALDRLATHLLARLDETPVGTARVVFSGDIAKIGRVCVTQSQRGTGLGAALIQAALDLALQTDGVRVAALDAQITAMGFYEKLGFAPTGPVFLDAGIEHRKMVRNLW